jgi:hypothetical protein
VVDIEAIVGGFGPGLTFVFIRAFEVGFGSCVTSIA